MGESRVCTICKELKDVSEFYVRTSGRVATECKKCSNKRTRDNYKKNRDSILKQKQDYYVQNLSTINNYRRTNRHLRRAAETTRRATDPVFRRRKNLSRRLLEVLKRGTYTKRSELYRILGCDYPTFIKHLEDNPYGFKVGTEGVEVDHIIPTSVAKTVEEVVELNHHTNIQLLPAYYNRHIKKDEIFNKDNFEQWLKQQPIIEL